MPQTKVFRPAPPPKPCYQFRPEPAQGTDWRGWEFCGSCRHFGNPADKRDQRHPTDPPPASAPRQRANPQTLAAAAERDARLLGEHDRSE